jgi:dynactin complex subunit
MAPHTPAGAGYGDIEVGDIVDVPGEMYGVVKFLGHVQGKKGTFVGVELSEEFASKGKNSGQVDG